MNSVAKEYNSALLNIPQSKTLGIAGQRDPSAKESIITLIPTLQMIEDMLFKAANKNCSDCLFACGALIELCQHCEDRLLNVYDAECREVAVVKVPKRYKKMTPEEIRKKEQAKLAREQLKLLKIRQAEEARAARLQAFMENLLLANMAPFLDEARIAGNPEFRIINDIIQTNINRGLGEFNRFYPDNLEGEFTRGPTNIRDIRQYIGYNKPLGFVGIALDVPPGAWLSKNGGDNEWMVAYHGTGLQATESILREGLRAGPGQAFRNNQNRNPLSANGPIGVGIFCTPNLPEAIAHNKATAVTCILQCRVNPRALKIADGINWVVNETANIRPYRLLLRLR